jgi:hypothetical protein
MEWVMQVGQDDLISRSQFHLQRPYFHKGSHSRYWGDTPFGKDTIPLISMAVSHIPIWRLGSMEWVTQPGQDDLIS